MINGYKKSKEDCSIRDYKDWCSAFRYGINNFGVNPMNFTMSKVRCGVTLHLVCAIVRKFTHRITN